MADNYWVFTEMKERLGFLQEAVTSRNKYPEIPIRYLQFKNHYDWPITAFVRATAVNIAYGLESCCAWGGPLFGTLQDLHMLEAELEVIAQHGMWENHIFTERVGELNECIERVIHNCAVMDRASLSKKAA